MKAAVLEEFQKPLVVREVPDPTITAKGAVIRVEANGVCRSDWHAWMGDWDWLGVKLPLPHVLGHEMSGVVEEVGSDVRAFRTGDRVIVPFSQGDGTCPMCQQGHQNICDHGQMPGFSYWGGFGRYVHVPDADVNLVRLPDNVGFTEAAALGCRFMTAFHGLIDQAEVRPGEWVAVHGCGGVGLSAIQIAKAAGANVIAVDIADDKLAFAKELGAAATINAKEVRAAKTIKQLTNGGAHVSVDALGVAATCQASISSLRKRGRHLQIGMTSRAEQGMIPLPIDVIVNLELRLVGSLGMPVHRYPQMLQMVSEGRLRPGDLVTNTVSIEEAGKTLQSMSDFATMGVTVVTDW
ncbi:zinc-dependent alcohol dehydrogenase family protein [Alicyclobacillus mengziensis]|uniref:Zinc-dependent alcohol dehydrogenase family protein n=1 Tax=Alicyclobacillus mengziensis TaxID=2931921 RepID=A0A9X7VW88_9BACL|nr:zinc-dependent alcohol dehydrogenase family protein [Alicyclobacillus mengziensis]QSO46194.1 zinc-dependent alcohol dehydrogenase family protein [Alicyclobacillus mengziensis]